MKIIRAFIPIMLIAAILVNAVGCAGTAHAVKAIDLMEKISPGSATGRNADRAFTASMADFSIELFKKSMSEDANSLISPLSVMLALAMTANGAGGETLVQMETLLGGGISLDELNEYLYSYATGLPSSDRSKLHIANSIWFRNEGLEVSDVFLQKNADFYRAAAYSSAFDEQAVTDINNWVKSNTDGMIDSILDEVPSIDVMMYLINALAFEAEWQSQYYDHNVRPGVFTNIGGGTQNASFMSSRESLYLDDGMATGFIKPYEGGYSFAALLPNENVPIDEYIASLTGAGFIDTLSNARHISVDTHMPKFEYDYMIKLNDVLIALGIPDAFKIGRADFSRIESTPSNALFISEVLHKTYISVDELGTKAGAVTLVAMSSGAAAPHETVMTVRLDRPFVYAIIDNATNLPVFIGTLLSV